MNSTEHLASLRSSLDELEHDVARIEQWGRQLATVLLAGGRALTVGNGGSAAHAQHLSAELVGRYVTDRAPFSSIALHSDTSALTALINDYGVEPAYSRSVQAHGRPGDVLIAFSTSGRSPNVLAAAGAALALRMRVLALTGPLPNPLAEIADEAIAADGPTPTVQEIHQVSIHLLCAAVDAALDVDAVRMQPAASLAGRNGVGR